MSENIETKTVKTRKEHRCWGCRELFPAGTKMEVWKCTDVGTIYSTYICMPCKIIYDDNFAGEEVMEGFAYD